MKILKYSGLRLNSSATERQGPAKGGIGLRPSVCSLSFVFSLIFLILLFSSMTGCAKTARYSPEELKGFPPEIQEHIKSGEVVIGMTTQQVRYAWGSPSAINVLPPTEEGKMKEEWIYSKLGLYLDKRLLFIDGKLVDIFPAPKPSGK